VPEMKVKDFALLREEVILDAEPLHGLKMTADDGVGDQIADSSRLVAAAFNVMERLQPQLEVLLVFFIPPRNAGVEIPAVVVKRYTAGWICDQRFNFSLSFFLEIEEADHHVRHLDSGVVN